MRNARRRYERIPVHSRVASVAFSVVIFVRVVATICRNISDRHFIADSKRMRIDYEIQRRKQRRIGKIIFIRLFEYRKRHINFAFKSLFESIRAYSFVRIRFRAFALGNVGCVPHAAPRTVRRIVFVEHGYVD